MPLVINKIQSAAFKNLRSARFLGTFFTRNSSIIRCTLTFSGRQRPWIALHLRKGLFIPPTVVPNSLVKAEQAHARRLLVEITMPELAVDDGSQKASSVRLHQQGEFRRDMVLC